MDREKALNTHGDVIPTFEQDKKPNRTKCYIISGVAFVLVVVAVIIIVVVTKNGGSSGGGGDNKVLLCSSNQNDVCSVEDSSPCSSCFTDTSVMNENEQGVLNETLVSFDSSFKSYTLEKKNWTSGFTNAAFFE